MMEYGKCNGNGNGKCHCALPRSCSSSCSSSLCSVCVSVCISVPFVSSSSSLLCNKVSLVVSFHCIPASAPRLVPYRVDHLVPVEPWTFPPRPPPRPPINSYPTFQRTPNSKLWSDLIWSCSRVPVSQSLPCHQRLGAVNAVLPLPLTHSSIRVPPLISTLFYQVLLEYPRHSHSETQGPKPKLPRQVCLSVQTISLVYSRAVSHLLPSPLLQPPVSIESGRRT